MTAPYIGISTLGRTEAPCSSRNRTMCAFPFLLLLEGQSGFYGYPSYHKNVRYSRSGGLPVGHQQRHCGLSQASKRGGFR